MGQTTLKLVPPPHFHTLWLCENGEEVQCTQITKYFCHFLHTKLTQLLHCNTGCIIVKWLLHVEILVIVILFHDHLDVAFNVFVTNHIIIWKFLVLIYDIRNLIFIIVKHCLWTLTYLPKTIFQNFKQFYICTKFSVCSNIFVKFFFFNHSPYL